MRHSPGNLVIPKDTAPLASIARRAVKSGEMPRGGSLPQGFCARSAAGNFTLLVSGCQATLTIHQR